MRVGLTFGEVLKEVKNGKIANRDKWFGGNSYPPRAFIFLRPEFKCELDVFEKIQSVPLQAKEEIKKAILSDKFGAEWSFDFEPYLCKFNESGKIENGWTPSQDDMLATDWMIYT